MWRKCSSSWDLITACMLMPLALWSYADTSSSTCQQLIARFRLLRYLRSESGSCGPSLTHAVRQVIQCELTHQQPGTASAQLQAHHYRVRRKPRPTQPARGLLRKLNTDWVGSLVFTVNSFIELCVHKGIMPFIPSLACVASDLKKAVS